MSRSHCAIETMPLILLALIVSSAVNVKPKTKQNCSMKRANKCNAKQQGNIEPLLAPKKKEKKMEIKYWKHLSSFTWNCIKKNFFLKIFIESNQWIQWVNKFVSQTHEMKSNQKSINLKRSLTNWQARNRKKKCRWRRRRV